MTDKQRNVPYRRFKEFENADAWEQRKFGDLYEVKSGFAFKNEDYTNQGVRIINGESIKHNKIESNQFNFLPESFKEKYSNFLLNEDDIVIGLNRPITNGELKIAQVPTKYTDSILYQRAGKINYIRPISTDFSFILLSKEILKFALRESVGSDQPFISTAKLSKWMFLIPKQIEEREQIGTFFKHLDHLITLHQRKYDKLKKLKSAYLTEMFPAEGERKPKRRFSGFTDDWEQCELNKLAMRFDNLRVPITKSNRISGLTPYYGANGIQDYVNGFTHNGEFILLAEDGANNIKNYPVRYVNGKAWINNHAHVLQAIQDIADNKFLVNALKNVRMEKFLVGGGRAKLNADILMKIAVKLPGIEEQQKIGILFDHLDHLITLHQQQLEKLKNLKQAYLNEMFV
ncbi:restriction endonuclease subunit S [Ligilactobacillus pobuzihii]|uniref:restriction endonuclease subunit S n=1 Tax=Ligilactobacillus pobuzihii TaxID=449659 RepID=UPI0019CFF8E2|nr:restriction endonuclease subunit S [Ligilactobacillus pobuzihii]MBN7275701.1 restriction endonuclease subunit S [Ligilactobacillus pobuzihii]